MRYEHIASGIFLSRPNRFIAQVSIERQTAVCHVKNTGRCKELLVPGARVYLEGNRDPRRKTAWDLVAVEKRDAQGAVRLINMDAQAPNRVFAEWVRAGRFLPGVTLLRPETVWEDSRFDFYLEAEGQRHLVEVKGVTLEEDGAVYFPDAPTQRGVKHLEGLARARREGYACWVCFVVQMEGAAFFAPNDRTHPRFGQALRTAAEGGVHVLALDCAVKPDRLDIREEVPVRL